MVNTTYKNTPFIRIYKQFDLFLVKYYHYCIINKKSGCFKRDRLLVVHTPLIVGDL